MDHIARLKKDYPWIQTPLIVGAPMRLIALAEMAVEVSKAGGIGFIGAGTDVSSLPSYLSHASSLLSSLSTPLPSKHSTLPIGIGFINWGASLSSSIPLIAQYRPAAVWFFAPSSLASLIEWTSQTRAASPHTKVWVQVGSVKQAEEVVDAVGPDVLVVQGTDAGGHGLVRGAGVVSLVPEVVDALALCRQKPNHTTNSNSPSSTSAPAPAPGIRGTNDPIILAAGGLTDSRSLLSSLALGASGIILGTRLLASPEAPISTGYKSLLLRATDGGQSTVRTKVYDQLRGTNWADSHNARGIINKSYEDAESGMEWEENKKLYKEEEGRGDQGWEEGGRMTAYAGSAVGLVREIKPVGEIVREVRGGVEEVLRRTRERLG